MKSRDLFPIIFLALAVLVMLGAFALATLQPVMESRTYNKLTGAQTTWWDALWVELRVQDQPLTK